MQSGSLAQLSFLTKSPKRYAALDTQKELAAGDNFWYGTDLTDGTGAFYSKQYHTFGYINLTDQRLSDIHIPDVEWLIIGCDTPVCGDRNPPDRAIVERIIQEKGARPLFMKDSPCLRAIWKDSLIQEIPTLIRREADKPIPHCNRCNQCRLISQGKRGNRHECWHRQTLKTYKNGRHIPGRYARTSPEWCPKRDVHKARSYRYA